jgi:hypothetical protein
MPVNRPMSNDGRAGAAGTGAASVAATGVVDGVGMGEAVAVAGTI